MKQALRVKNRAQRIAPCVMQATGPRKAAPRARHAVLESTAMNRASNVNNVQRAIIASMTVTVRRSAPLHTLRALRVPLGTTKTTKAGPHACLAFQALTPMKRVR